MYDVGIIGGMGSSATVEMFNRFIKYTKALSDNDYMRICILNDSKIPDRTTAIINDSDAPVEYLNKAINDLINLNCMRFVIACNTAHYYKNKLVNLDKIKFIDMVLETSNYIATYYTSYKICILGTNGTINADIYKNTLLDDVLYYPEKNLQDVIMQAIIETKKTDKTNDTLLKILKVMKSIENKFTGSKVLFVLACTEISLYYEELLRHYKVVDAMDIVVIKAIEESGYQVKEEALSRIYNTL